MDINLFSLSGCHGAGKDVLCAMLAEQLREFGFRTIIPCTSRPPRVNESEGDPYYFLSPEEFRRGVDAGEFVFYTPIRGHHSGTKREELLRSPYSLINIVPHGARYLKDMVIREGLGTVFMIFIHVPSDMRRARIIRREPELKNNPAKVEILMGQDPVPSDVSLYADFDLIIENPDGKLDETVQTIKDYVNGIIHA